MINNDLKKVLAEVNSLASSILDDIEIREKERIKQIGFILYEKIRMDYNAIIILLEESYVDQACAITRTMYDKIFVLRAVLLDEKNLEKLHRNHMSQRKRLIKNVKELELITKTLEEEYLNSPNLNDAKSITIKEWATLAEMKDVYFREYQYYSNYVHVSDKSIRDCCRLKDGILTGIDMSPQEDMVDIIALTAANNVIMVMNWLGEKYLDNYSEIIETLNRKIAELQDVYGING